MELKGDWKLIKQVLDDRKLKAQYLEFDSSYYVVAMDGSFKVWCWLNKAETAPNSSDQKDFEDNYKAAGNSPVKEHGTLKIARGKKTPGATGGVYEIKLKVPGTPGSGDGRIVKGGQGWFNNHHVDDFAEIFIQDDDNILGGGSNQIVGTYTDTEVDEANQGWYFEPDGCVRLDALIDAGFIPSGMYLHMKATKGDGVTNDTFRCNIKWGKRE